MEQYTVQTATVFKQGQGKRGPWTLYKLTLVGNPQEPTGFDVVNPGDLVTLETTSNTGNDGKTYQNVNYKKVEGAAAAPAAAATTQAAPATAAGNPNDSKRILKLLTLIATQVGIDNDKILEVLSDN